MVNSQHPVDANASVFDTPMEVLDLIPIVQISFSTFIPWLSYTAARSPYMSFTEKLKPRGHGTPEAVAYRGRVPDIHCMRSPLFMAPK